jgi:hypothetical protein
MRDPVGVVSKVNFIDDGLFGSAALSSPSCASNELIGLLCGLFGDRGNRHNHFLTPALCSMDVFLHR